MRLVPVLALLAAAALMGGAARPATVDYSLSPVFDGETLKAVAVEVRFTGEADGETRVRLPDDWGGQAELWKSLSGFKIAGGKLETPSPAVRVVKHRPGARIVLRYQVTSGYPGDPPAGNTYRPAVRPGWFHLIGEGAFVEPEGQKAAPATFTWKRWPKTWTLASDLDHAATARTTTVADVLESVSLGAPALKVMTRTIPGGRLRVAVLGDWSFAPEAFGDQLARIIAAQRRFWNDVDGPYFVSLIPTQGPGVTSLGGTGRSDGFALFATTNVDQAMMTYLIAHEHTHTWIAPRLGRLSAADEAADYWFSEGFTDFYAYRTLLRSGVWSLEDFARQANESLAAYDSSPVRTAPNSRVVKAFWSDPSVQKLPYQRGLLLAFHWDEAVRRATRGARDLDDVMMLMRDRAAAARTPDEVELARPGFVRAMKDVAGLDVTADIARHVEAGEPVALPTALLEGCARLVTEPRPVFARGWNAEATSAAGNIVTGLRPDSPAYAAGLRDGMAIVKRETGKVGDARVEYALRVRDGATERMIRFLPQGRERFTAREIVIHPDLDDAARKTCAARMGGD